VNLDFENASLIPDHSSGAWGYYASNAIPGWTLFARDSAFQGGDVYYDNFSLGGGAVSLIDTNTTSWGYNYPPIQGKYYVMLMSFNYPGYEYTVGIGQTGQVPTSAQSITFLGSATLNALSFNGQILPLTVIGNGANYNIYGADISSFAGQTGLLLFETALPSGGATIDDIQFSSSPVPEPTVYALAALGTLLFSLPRRRN
jgi:hypothetical protein